MVTNIVSQMPVELAVEHDAALRVLNRLTTLSMLVPRPGKTAAADLVKGMADNEQKGILLLAATLAGRIEEIKNFLSQWG